VVYIGENRNAHRNLVGNSEGIDQLKELGSMGRCITKIVSVGVNWILFDSG
jgi:hypothetical protein